MLKRRILILKARSSLYDGLTYFDPDNEDWFPEQEDLDSLDKVDVVIIDY